MADEDTMLFWLARAASKARDEADRKQVHVAAGADVDQSTIWRFERAGAWPRNPDKVVAAYADDLDIGAFDLWEEALRMWREHRGGITHEAGTDPRDELERESAEAAEEHARRAVGSESGVRARRRAARAR